MFWNPDRGYQKGFEKAIEGRADKGDARGYVMFRRRCIEGAGVVDTAFLVGAPSEGLRELHITVSPEGSRVALN